MLRASVMVLCVLSGAARAAPDDGLHKLLGCMRDNVPPTVRIQEIELDATDRGGGVRSLKGRLYAMNDQGLIRASLRIAQPADLSGAAYLLRETPEGHADEMYLFLPSLNRVRRISGTSADGSLLGTDFSYNDIRQLEDALAGSDPVLEQPAQIEQRPMQVLLLKPRPAQDSRYTMLRSWIDQQSCVALKVDFYEGEQLRKQLTAPASALLQSGKYWYLTQAQMRDLKNGTRTALKVLGVSSGSELSSRYFDPHSFYLGN